MGFLGTFVKVACVAGIGVIAVTLFKRSGDKIKKILGKSEKPGGEKPPESLSKEQYEKAKAEFAEKSFTDVYESIYKVSQGQSKRSNDILEDLDSRIYYLKNSPNIQAFWRSLFNGYESFSPEKLKETTAEFMKFVFEAGIQRDNSDQVTVDETTHRKYYNSDDGDFVKGEIMKVERACWSLGDKILEKGELTSL